MRGQLVIDNKKGHATEKLNIVAGLLNNKIIAPLVYEYSTDATLFNTWLAKVLIPELPENSIIIMDNARFHKTSETKEIIEIHNHRLLFLPAYSPDFNPIEHTWATIKKLIKIIFQISLTFILVLNMFSTHLKPQMA